MLLDPESPEPWYRLAVLEYDDLEALDAINEALARDASNASYFGTRGEIYERQEDFARALADYDRAVHLDKERDSVLWISYRARLLRKVGRWDDAWRDYTRAFRRAPRSTTFLHERACILVDKGDIEGARRELDRVVAAHPELLISVREKALVCHRLGDFGAALAAIDHVIAYRDEFDHYIRGAILFATGDVAAALAAFDAGMAGDASAYPFEARRAQCLLALGQPSEALAACDRAIHDAPYCEAIRFLRARVLQSLGGREALRRALADVRRAIERAPNGACYRAEKAAIHARQGRVALAAEEARRALGLLRKPQAPPRIYHALLEHYEARGLDLGHPVPVSRELLLQLARRSKA